MTSFDAAQLLGISHIETSPSLLESTTLVFAYGLDIFSSRTMPSGSFDILSDSFNKAQLLLTMVGLIVGIVLTKVCLSSPDLSPSRLNSRSDHFLPSLSSAAHRREKTV